MLLGFQPRGNPIKDLGAIFILRKLKKSVMLLGFQPRGNPIKDLLNIKEHSISLEL